MLQEREPIQFISLSSGSSGNCYYIGNSKVSFLIDAGVAGRTVKKSLAHYGINWESIEFILVTHDHIDHVKHLSTISRRIEKPVVTTQTILSALERNKKRAGGPIKFYKTVEKGMSYSHKGVTITPFEVPHDATENIAFFIQFREESFLFLTDVGSVTKEVISYIRRANHLIIESNYDCEMLAKGNYPSYLIERISNGYGHLSNHETAAALVKGYHSGLKSIFLCHLSNNNNTPELAYSTSYSALTELGVSVGEEVKLYCLPRKNHTSYTIAAER